MEPAYHVPVLLNESIDGLAIRPDGVYIDCTFGGGGHSAEILKRLTTGKLLAFDQDEDAWKNIPQNDNLLFAKGNFRFLRNFVHYHKLGKVDGILADLGVSSHHFDEAGRGFSIRFDGELDMRMNQQAKLTAKTVVNEYPADKLKEIFYQYGEIDNSGKLVWLIENARKSQAINTIEELKSAIITAAPRNAEIKYFAKVFQALRIEVNQEMEALKLMLEQTAEVLAPGGRLVVITYHSLEDRLVKNYMKNGQFSGQPEKDLFGRVSTPFTVITRKVIVPSDEELKVNNRARSAKLRIAERNED